MSREKLAALERLQTIDVQIEELTRQADAFPTRMAELEKDVAKAKAVADAERGRLADNERARHQLEGQLAEDKDKLVKWESRLPQLKHQREFAALEREIISLQKSNEDAAENLAKLQTAADPLKASLYQKDAEVTSRESVRAKALADSSHNEAALRKQLAELQAQREKDRAAVDAKLITAYEQVRKRRPGKVVVPMVNNLCSGCNRRLLPQLANTLHAGAIEQCPSCSRIVYFPRPPPEASL